VTERTSDLVRIKERLEGELAERERMEKERELVLDLLGIINSAGDVRRVRNDLAVFLSRWTGCDAVGIRLRSGFDYPYVETIGFPEGFVAAESRLYAVGRDGEMIRDGDGNTVYECLCGEVVCGRPVLSAPSVTPHGSFWLLAEEALKESEDRFRSLVENSLVGIMIVQDGRVVFRNPEQERLLGPIPEEFEFRSINNVFPEDVPRFEQLCDLMETGSSLRQDVDLRFSLDAGDTLEREVRWVHCQTRTPSWGSTSTSRPSSTFAGSPGDFHRRTGKGSMW